MYSRYFFAIFCGFAIGVPAFADYEDIGRIEQYALSFATQHFTHQIKDRYNAEEVRVSLSNIDRRLKLHKCDKGLIYKPNELRNSIANSSLKISCPGSTPWSIYVPIRLDTFVDVVIANQSLARGEKLTQDDLALQRVNISTLRDGFLTASDQAIGMELKRSLSANDILKRTQLKAPDVVHRNQQVILLSKSSLLSVQTTAIAMRSGAVGDVIKVKNEKSDRIISAKVIAEGKVQTFRYK